MILDKLEQLKSRFIDGRDDTKFTLKQWENEINESFVLDNLAKHDGIKLLREKIKSTLEMFDDSLRSPKTTEEERKKIFAEKEVYEWFDELFENASKSLESKEKEIDYQLNID